MPTLSVFYGIVISMYFLDNLRHRTAHIHARYQEPEAVFAIESGEVLEGSLPRNKERLVVAWIEIHREELLENWKLASQGNALFKIEPLK